MVNGRNNLCKDFAGGETDQNLRIRGPRESVSFCSLLRSILGVGADSDFSLFPTCKRFSCSLMRYCVCLCLWVFFGLFISFVINMNTGCLSKFDVLSLNVRGITDQIKRRSIFSYLKDQKANIYFFTRNIFRASR